VRDNSFQHFTELDEKAVFLRGLWCGRTVSLLRGGNLQRAVFLLVDGFGEFGRGLRRG
jgi:hypothetical protein